MLFVGIDPGQTGGIAVLDHNKNLLKFWNMPFDSDTGYIGYDWITQLVRLEQYRPLSGIKIWVERNQGLPGNSWDRAFKFGYATGQIIGMLRVRGFELNQVRPLTWRDAVLGKTARKKGKKPAILYVLKNYDLAVPHDGISDAICIAEYGWLINKGAIK